MAQRYQTLTGRWLGRYDYGDARPPVAFEADLIDEGGTLTGMIDEPNSFRAGAGPVLLASVEGTRDGAEVAFLKRYQGFDRFTCPNYRGRANAALTRIDGQWWFALDRAQTGRFVMMRKPRAGARAERKVGAEVE